MPVSPRNVVVADRLACSDEDEEDCEGDGAAMDARLVLRQRLIQGAMAAHVGNVEGQAFIERLLGRVADEGRRHHVAFAVPERDHVAQFTRTHGKVGDVFGMQVANLGAHAIESVTRAGQRR